MDIKTDNDPDDSLSSGSSQMPFSKMVDNALSVMIHFIIVTIQSLSGRGTFAQICQHIENTFPQALKNRKSWKSTGI